MKRSALFSVSAKLWTASANITLDPDESAAAVFIRVTSAFPKIAAVTETNPAVRRMAIISRLSYAAGPPAPGFLPACNDTALEASWNREYDAVYGDAHSSRYLFLHHQYLCGSLGGGMRGRALLHRPRSQRPAPSLRDRAQGGGQACRRH